MARRWRRIKHLELAGVGVSHVDMMNQFTVVFAVFESDSKVLIRTLIALIWHEASGEDGHLGDVKRNIT